MVQTSYKHQYEVLQKEFSHFSYIVSHDLRAPLRHIRQFSRLLIDDAASSNTSGKQSDYLHYLESALDQSEAMLEGLSHLSKIVACDRPFVEVSTAALFEHIASRLQGGFRDVKERISFPDHDYTIMGDSDQLEELFFELLTNSLQFRSPDRLPDISISITPHDNTLLFTVKDNGIGIDSKYWDEVFVVFRQINPDTPGLGLGLAASQRIVERHGGRIWLESEVDKGSSFFIELPASSATAP